MSKAVDGTVVAEKMIRCILSSGVSPRDFFVGLHNAFFHEDILVENDVEFTDEQLGGLFDHFDGLGKIAKSLK